jgi:hypothetical protein
MLRLVSCHAPAAWRGRHHVRQLAVVPAQARDLLKAPGKLTMQCNACMHSNSLPGPS